MAMAWRVDEEPAQIVIALLEGRQSQQSWENLARALHTAKHLVAPGGSIVLCTDITKGPGAGLQKLRNVHNSPEAIARKLTHETADDALAAAVILDTTKNYHVYLVSHLKPETVEGLGMGVIQDAAQLEHLCQQHSSCAVLGSAQHRFVPNS
jgi:nickel-dependent lactate racemase